MTGPAPIDQERTLEHVSRNRAAIKAAHDRVWRASRGQLQDGLIRLGLDPTKPEPGQWWAMVTLKGGRAGVEVLTEDHPSGVAALEALGDKMVATMRHLVRRRRR